MERLLRVLYLLTGVLCGASGFAFFPAFVIVMVKPTAEPAFTTMIIGVIVFICCGLAMAFCEQCGKKLGYRTETWSELY